MKSTKRSHVFLLSLIVVTLSLLLKTSAQNSIRQPGGNVMIPKCADYPVTRHSTESSYIENGPFTQKAFNSERQPITLELVFGRNKGLKCDPDETEERSISWELENSSPNLGQRYSTFVVNGSSTRHAYPYFTETGHFYDKETGNYYDPDGFYCVKSMTDDKIDLRVCAVNSDCSNISTPNTYCLPKCCALDETLLFWKRQCARIPETHGMTPWKPPLYQGSKNPHKLVQSNIIYHMAQLPQNCEMLEMNKSSSSHRVYTYRLYSSTYVKHPIIGGESQQNDIVKLTLPSKDRKNGNIQLILLDHSNRKWLGVNYNSFCVEGFYVKSKGGPKYTGDPDNFVVIYCPNPGEDTQTIKDEKMIVVKSWTYIAVSLFVMVFLLVTLLIYLVLWDKHNLHGLTILSYAGSMFGSYFFLTVAHFISLYPNSEVTGLHKRGWFCYAVSALAHYFFLSSYLWLTVISFDLWMTFHSIRIVNRDSKEWRKFTAYSAVGFVFPAALIIAFVVIDHVYRNPITEVPVPDYAVDTCFVSVHFRGQYLYTPMAILIGINIVLICMTMWIFIRARRDTSKTFTASSGASNVKRYNAKLFVKLFILMGGTSIIDFLTWYFNNKGAKPWYILLLEVMKYSTPVALFVLFCLNDKVVGQLREKFPGFIVFHIFTKKGKTGLGSSSPATSKSNCSDALEGRGEEEIPLCKR